MKKDRETEKQMDRIARVKKEEKEEASSSSRDDKNQDTPQVSA